MPDYLSQALAPPRKPVVRKAAASDYAGILEQADAVGRARARQEMGYGVPSTSEVEREGDGQDYFAAVAPPVVKGRAAAAPKPVDPLEPLKPLTQKREVLNTTESLYRQRLKEFDDANGFKLKDDGSGTLVDEGPTYLQAQDSAARIAALGPNVSAIRDPMKDYQLLLEKRQRIADEADRVSKARQEFDTSTYIPARDSLLQSAQDQPTGPAQAPAYTENDYLTAGGSDWVSQKIQEVNAERYRAGRPPINAGTVRADSTGTSSDNGELRAAYANPAPVQRMAPGEYPGLPTDAEVAAAPQPDDSVARMQSRVANYEATLSGGGDNLAPRVRDNVQRQIDLLKQKLDAAEEAQVARRTALGRGGLSDELRSAIPVSQRDQLDRDSAMGPGADTPEAAANPSGLSTWEAANSPFVRAPEVSLPEHPIIEGLLNATGDVASSFTSPLGAATIGGMGSLVRAAKAGSVAAKASLAAIEAAFAGQMAPGVGAGAAGAMDSTAPTGQRVRAGAGAAIQAAMALASSAHARGNVEDIIRQARDNGTIPPTDAAPPGGAVPPGSPAPTAPTGPAPADEISVDPDISAAPIRATIQREQPHPVTGETVPGYVQFDRAAGGGRGEPLTDAERAAVPQPPDHLPTGQYELQDGEWKPVQAESAPAEPAPAPTPEAPPPLTAKPRLEPADLALPQRPELAGRKVKLDAVDQSGRKTDVEMDASEAWSDTQKRRNIYSELLRCLQA